MATKLLLERVCGEERLAVLEDGELMELYVSRGAGSLVGDIYVGRVQNVSPGLDAAFVDIGLENNAYLSAADWVPGEGETPPGPGAPIGEKLKAGQEILLQVVKEPGGSKGCRASMALTLAGRVTVLKPMDPGIAVSHRIEDAGERGRLTAIVRETLRGTGCGAILRTAAEGADEAALKEELDALLDSWRSLRALAAVTRAPARLSGGEDLAVKAVRDCLHDGVEAIVTDSGELHDRLAAALAALAPSRRGCLKPLWEGSLPVFDAERVDAQLEKAMRRIVWLKSGGFLAIDETEALTVVDVNTGKYTGGQTLENTVLDINLEAVREIARQLRLRALGGIVIVDFIDMASPGDRQALMEAMAGAVKADRAQVTVVDMTPLGLMELTRRRTRMPLSRQLYHICEDCGGSGFVLSHESTARRALRELWVRSRGGQTGFRLTAPKPVTDWVRTLGTPEGIRLRLCPDERMPAGTYRIEGE